MEDDAGLGIIIFLYIINRFRLTVIGAMKKSVIKFYSYLADAADMSNVKSSTDLIVPGSARSFSVATVDSSAA